MKSLFLLFIITLTFTSCAVLNSVSQTSIPKNKSKIINATVERNIIFLMNFDNDYVDNLTRKLVELCPNGSVEGITTKDQLYVYFPIIFHKRVVESVGYCTGAR